MSKGNWLKAQESDGSPLRVQVDDTGRGIGIIGHDNMPFSQDASLNNRNSLLKIIPTKVAIPFDHDQIANYTSSLWPSCTLEVDESRVCPASGQPSARLTVVAGETRNNEIRWFNLGTPFEMGDDDVFLIPIFCPQTISSGWVYLRLRAGPVGNEPDFRTIGAPASHMRQGWNVLVLKNTEVVVGTSEYGNTNGTSVSTYNAWTTGGAGLSESETIRSITLLIGGVGGVDWGIGGVYRAPKGWCKAAVMWGADDVPLSFYDLAMPILESYGWKVTLNHSVHLFNDPVYAPIERMVDANKRGHEIWGHTLTHPTMTAVSVSEQARQLEQSRVFWTSRGMASAAKCMAWPANAYNDETLASAVAAGVKVARAAAGVHFQSWIPATGLLCLPSLQVETSNPWHVDAVLNGVCLRGQAVITYMHNTVAGGNGLTSYPAANSHYADHLRRWCDLVASHVAEDRAQVFTMSEYFQAVGIDVDGLV